MNGYDLAAVIVVCVTVAFVAVVWAVVRAGRSAAVRPVAGWPVVGSSGLSAAAERARREQAGEF